MKVETKLHSQPHKIEFGNVEWHEADRQRNSDQYTVRMHCDEISSESVWIYEYGDMMYNDMNWQPAAVYVYDLHVLLIGFCVAVKVVWAMCLNGSYRYCNNINMKNYYTYTSRCASVCGRDSEIAR